MSEALEARDIYLLTKISRLVIPISSFLLGFLISGGTSWISTIIPISTFVFVYASAATLNDIADIEIDRITNSNRPLPSKKLGKTGALALAIMFTFIGLFVAYSVSLGFNKPYFFWGIVVEALAGILYSIILSKNFISANSTLGITHGFLPFSLGFYLFGGFFNLTFWIIGLMVWAILFLTYNLKDLKDFEGDKLTRITLPVLVGLEKAKWFNSLFLISAVPISILAFLVRKSTNILGLIVSLVLALMLAALGQYLTKSKNKDDFTKMLNMFRILMAMFLLSLAV